MDEEREMQMSGTERKFSGHWDAVYAASNASLLSWHQRYPFESLELIRISGVGKDSSVIDVGGGASLLADALLDQEYSNVTVLDCSRIALEQARCRLGARAECIRWRVADIRWFRTPEKFMLWHDRAVFHFMVDADSRRNYLETLDSCLTPEGRVMLGTFAPGGPHRCSGLDVAGYDEDRIHEVFAPRFKVEYSMSCRHETPSGSQQDFMFFYMRRRPD